MQQKLKTIKQNALTFVLKFGDIRFTGQVIFVALVLLITWSGVKTIQTNYTLQKKISILKQQNNLQKLQNQNTALKNDYLKSDQYLELSARQNFGLAAPGEKMVVVPELVALSYTIDPPKLSDTVGTIGSNGLNPAKQPAYQKNLRAWVDFFLNRPSSQSQ